MNPSHPSPSKNWKTSKMKFIPSKKKDVEHFNFDSYSSIGLKRWRSFFWQHPSLWKLNTTVIKLSNSHGRFPNLKISVFRRVSRLWTFSCWSAGVFWLGLDHPIDSLRWRDVGRTYSLFVSGGGGAGSGGGLGVDAGVQDGWGVFCQFMGMNILPFWCAVASLFEITRVE